MPGVQAVTRHSIKSITPKRNRWFLSFMILPPMGVFISIPNISTDCKTRSEEWRFFDRSCPQTLTGGGICGILKQRETIIKSSTQKKGGKGMSEQLQPIQKPEMTQQASVPAWNRKEVSRCLLPVLRLVDGERNDSLTDEEQDTLLPQALGEMADCRPGAGNAQNGTPCHSR